MGEQRFQKKRYIGIYEARERLTKLLIDILNYRDDLRNIRIENLVVENPDFEIDFKVSITFYGKKREQTVNFQYWFNRRESQMVLDCEYLIDNQNLYWKDIKEIRRNNNAKNRIKTAK